MLISKRASTMLVRRPATLAAITVLGVLLTASPGSAQTAPVAGDDGYNVTTGQVLIEPAFGVLNTDSDADGDILTVYQVNGSTANVGVATATTQGGSVTLASNGYFEYTPPALFTGTDTFTYACADDEEPTPNISNAATVSIAVQPPTHTIAALEGGCVNESNGLLNNCTANDLTFVELGLGTQTDGCVNSADRVTIFLRGVVRNATAQTRYDVGMWFPLPYTGTNPDYLNDPIWGAKIDPEGDGALTGDCGVVGLMNPEPGSIDPLNPITPTDLCYFDTGGALDLNGSQWSLPGEEIGHGPWSNDDNGNYDSCGDIQDDGHNPGCDLFPADTNWDDSVIIFDSTLDLDCNDLDADGLTDGFVNTSVCLSWGNQANQVDDPDCLDPWCGNDLCDLQEELRPGTKSKCRCEDYQITNVPAPEVSVTCALPVDAAGQPIPAYDVGPGGFIRLAVSYNNSCTCTPDTATEERFRCCTASYIEFPITYDNTLGSISLDPDNLNYPGTLVLDDDVNGIDTDGVFYWKPESTENGLTKGKAIIAQGESAELFFYFNVADPLPDGTTLPATDVVAVGSQWANEIDYLGNLINPVEQIALTGTCGFNVTSTWASVSNVAAEVRGGRTVVSWETSAEAGSIGFDVYRSEDSGDTWDKVNETLVPALGDGPGGRYELADDGGLSSGTVMYKVEEVDLRGRRLEAHPVRVELHDVDMAAPVDDRVAMPRRPSVRIRKNVERSARQGALTKSTAVRTAPGGGRMTPVHPAFVKIGVAETGLYRVTAAEIAAALGETETKIQNRIHNHRLALSTGGIEVAWKADRGDSGIVFYGQAPDTLYDTSRFYRLRTGRGLEIEEAAGQPPWPAAERGSFRDLVLAEEDRMLRPFNIVDEDGDFWFWGGLLANDPEYGEKTLRFRIEDVADAERLARATVGFVGYAPGENVSAAVHINGHFVGEIFGPILEHTSGVFSFPQTHLVSGENEVRIVGRSGGVLIDRIDLEYERLLHASGDELTVRNPEQAVISIDGFSTQVVDAYDITDPFRPVLLPSDTKTTADGTSVELSFKPTSEGDRYLAVASSAIRSPASIEERGEPGLRAEQRGADYVVITTSGLKSAAGRLAAFRGSEGLETMVVDVEDIFEEFGFGSRDPHAITAFLAEAAGTWQIPPKYVLLAGRGHYDYKDLMGYGGNLLPPALATTDDGLVPSDNKLVDLDGDGYPDVAVGRLPVLTAAELDAAIDKIIAYENSESGEWAKKVTLAADNPDSAGDFIRSSDDLAKAVPENRQVEKVYIAPPYSPASTVHSWLMRAFNEGVGIVNWIGHAGLDSLANERVLAISDLAAMEETTHPPVTVALTCLLNNFGFPYFATLGEELSLHPGGGAIGVWSASGLFRNANAELLGEEFMAALGDDEPGRLGDIILTAIENYDGPGADRKLANGYVLFGDPALMLK